MNPLLDPKTEAGYHNVGRNPHDCTLEELKKAGFEPRSAAKAVRHFCFECIGENWHDIAECGSVSCSLWPFRMGSKPKAWRGLRAMSEGHEPHAPMGVDGSVAVKPVS